MAKKTKRVPTSPPAEDAGEVYKRIVGLVSREVRRYEAKKQGLSTPEAQALAKYGAFILAAVRYEAEAAEVDLASKSDEEIEAMAQEIRSKGG